MAEKFRARAEIRLTHGGQADFVAIFFTGATEAKSLTFFPSDMPCELDGDFWNDLLTLIEGRDVIPIIGPGATTFGPEDAPLYPHLAAELARNLRLTPTASNPLLDLGGIVDAVRERGGKATDVHKRLYALLREVDPQLPPPKPAPGRTLQRLVSIEPFRLFLSTTCDSLLADAAKAQRKQGFDANRVHRFGDHSTMRDLPVEFQDLNQVCIYYLLGQVNPKPDFVLWDDDALHCLLQLDKTMDQWARLRNALKESHLLFIGVNFAHWLLRFLIHVVRGRPISDIADRELYLAQHVPADRRDEFVVFFTGLNSKLHVVPVDPRLFVAQLTRKWRHLHPVSNSLTPPANEYHDPEDVHPASVFISYASPDVTVARGIREQLVAARCPVWFDREQLMPGMRWDDELTDAVERKCSVFLSLISANTERKVESYYIKERNLAMKRRDYFDQRRPFFIPVRIDNGPFFAESEPIGTAKLQTLDAPGGQLQPTSVRYICRLVCEYCEDQQIPKPSCCS